MSRVVTSSYTQQTTHRYPTTIIGLLRLSMIVGEGAVCAASLFFGKSITLSKLLDLKSIFYFYIALAAIALLFCLIIYLSHIMNLHDKMFPHWRSLIVGSDAVFTAFALTDGIAFGYWAIHSYSCAGWTSSCALLTASVSSFICMMLFIVDIIFWTRPTVVV